MTRSARLSEAIAALDEYREHRQPDLFSVTRESPRSATRQWKEAAQAAIREAAIRLDCLTVEDVIWPSRAHAVDERARGAALLTAARAGVIEVTDEYRRAGPDRHGRPMRVFRSLLRKATDGP